MLEALERDVPVRARIESLDGDPVRAMADCSKDLREKSHGPHCRTMSPDDQAAHRQLCHAQVAVAVRSSATSEDAKDASFAGLQDTYLWVRGTDEVLRMVRSCWASLYSVESVSYRRQRGMDERGVAMAVVVQTMVDARTAGVMFTRSPTTGDRSVVAIEAAWGLGSAVVGGEVTPDRWVVGKITGEISVRDISTRRSGTRRPPRAASRCLQSSRSCGSSPA
jgi:pyruvate,water dikinase